MQTQKFTLSSEQKMSTEEQSNRPRSGHTEKEIHMQTQLNQTSPASAPMVRCIGAGTARRQSIEELLAEVRVTDATWFARFEDANLSVVASADLMQVVELIATAPCERLAGLCEGMWLNN